MISVLKRVGAVALASAALCAAPTAHADVFSFEWASRWSSGQIQRDASVVDSDPSAARDRGESEHFLHAMNGATSHQRIASPVPEPATWALFGLGFAGLAVRRRRG